MSGKRRRKELNADGADDADCADECAENGRDARCTDVGNHGRGARATFVGWFIKHLLIERGGVARIDVFFSGWRNGDGRFARKDVGKNFGFCRERNSNAQLVARVGFADTTMARGFATGSARDCGGGSACLRR